MNWPSTRYPGSSRSLDQISSAQLRSPFVSGTGRAGAAQVPSGLDGGSIIGESSKIERAGALNNQHRAWQFEGATFIGMLEILAGLVSLVLFMLRPKEKEFLWFRHDDHFLCSN